MISGIFHQGSGLGNQLHRYVMTRVIAADKDYDFGMCNPENFKGSSFMNIAMGLESKTDIFFLEKKVVENGIDIRGYDPEIHFIEDNTLIDGEFQDERYFEHRLFDIRSWLKVKPRVMNDNICVINFRGGEYATFPDLYLPKAYWDTAIMYMRHLYPHIHFEVHTDDPDRARIMLGDYDIIHDIGLNWRSIRYAKHLILSNSSFAILPSLLNPRAKEIIAPRYWARHNLGVWALPQNYYTRFIYL